jgi:Domain of unknown function (DUF4333)
MRVPRGALAVVVGALFLAFALYGCEASFEVGGDNNSISDEDVASKARTQLSKKFTAEGLPPLPPVTCEDDLEEKVGATTHCTAKGDFGRLTGTLGITATVTSVKGSRTELHFETDKAGVKKLTKSSG